MAKRKTKKCEHSVIHWIAFVLLVVGGLNWGLVGIWNFDLVAWLLGSIPWLQRTVYILVGLSALIGIHAGWKKM